MQAAASLVERWKWTWKHGTKLCETLGSRRQLHSTVPLSASSRNKKPPRCLHFAFGSSPTPLVILQMNDHDRPITANTATTTNCCTAQDCMQME